MEMLWVLLLFSFGVHADEDCNYSEEPRFYMEPSMTLFYSDGSDVQLAFCEASDICHIEWLKDGAPLNFSDSHVTGLGRSKDKFVLQPARVSDSGNYTCVVSNNVGTVNRTIEIVIDGVTTNHIEFDPSPQTPDRPLTVGKSYWYRWRIISTHSVDCYFVKISNEGSKFDEFVPSCSSTKDASVCCQCTLDTTYSEVTYATLRLANVREEDLGDYRLLVEDVEIGFPSERLEFSVRKNMTSGTEIEENKVFAPVAAVVFIIVFLTVTWQAFKLNIQLYVKDHFGRPEVFDGRSYDAYISYTWSDVDRAFVLHLKAHLERLGYRIYVPEVDNLPGGCTVSQLVDVLQRSRRFIMVLSPGYFRANFTHYEVNMFVEALARYKEAIIPIVFGDSGSMDSNILFKHVIKVSQTIKWMNIEWPLSDKSLDETTEGSALNTIVLDSGRKARVGMEQSFKMRGFKQLLLRLPPRPKRFNQGCSLV